MMADLDANISVAVFTNTMYLDSSCGEASGDFLEQLAWVLVQQAPTFSASFAADMDRSKDFKMRNTLIRNM